MALLSNDRPVLTSETHGHLFHDFWFDKVAFYDGGLFIAIDGDPQVGEGLTLYRWDRRGLQSAFRTTAREGMFDAQQILVPEGTRDVYFASYTALVYHWSKDTGFRRFADVKRPDPLIRLDGHLYQGHKYPVNGFEPLGDHQASAAVNAINTRLPDFRHPTEGRVYLNQMIFSQYSGTLAIGYRLHDKILVFSEKTGEVVRRISLRNLFPGYLLPDPKFDLPKGPELRKRLPAWYASFHHLEKLAWHGGKLFALLRQGFDGYGIWVCLDDPKRIHNNDQSPQKILAVGGNELLWGRVDESKDGNISWQLWRSSEF